MKFLKAPQVNYEFALLSVLLCNVPIYTVGEFSLTINDELSSSLFFGTGILFYPIRFIQLGFSLGILFPLSAGFYYDYEGEHYYAYADIDAGFSFNISLAYEFCNSNFGWLFGVQYSWSTHDVPDLDRTISASSFCLFVKYAGRRKIPSQTTW